MRKCKIEFRGINTDLKTHCLENISLLLAIQFPLNATHFELNVDHLKLIFPINHILVYSISIETIWIPFVHTKFSMVALDESTIQIFLHNNRYQAK